jgi:uncharacterized membrane protein YbhN (UPF0104 family)
VLTIAFFAAVAWLLVSQARRIDWGDVMGVMRSYPHDKLLAAFGFAALAHTLYGSYDLLGRAWTRHGLPRVEVVAVTFVSYAFNLNFGSLVGGIAFRYRLYSQLGLGKVVITRVLGLSLATNWLGYLVLAGALFALALVVPPAHWPVSPVACRALGVALLLAGAAYLAVCAWSPRRDWQVRGHTVSLPPLRLALLQLMLSCAHWLCGAAVLYMLLAPQLSYPTVLSTLMMAAVAGVITHIPAGLGVLEAVFLALVGDLVPSGELLAAVLAYRALYYLGPLLTACIVYVLIEAHARRKKASA